MANLFNAADLFGNVRPQDFNAPEWSQNVTSNDYGGGTSQLNSAQFATPQSAQATAQFLGGTVTQPSYYGTSPSVPELGISFSGTPTINGAQPHSLNAGLVNQTLDYARKGRYNADTGQYDKEDWNTVLNRLRADVAGAPGVGGNQGYMVGVHPASSVQKPVPTYNAYNDTNRPGQATPTPSASPMRPPAAAQAPAPAQTRPTTPTAPPPSGGGSAQPGAPPRTPGRPTAPPPTLGRRTARP